MKHLAYINTTLYFEQIALQHLADAYGTPLYAYSEAALTENYRRIERAFQKHPHIICYALKANSNPVLLRKLAGLGAGADVVSGGELRLAMDAGIPPEKIVFAGVGKRDDEIVAALQAGIKGLNVESEMELEVIDELAGKTGTQAPVSLRVNPNLDIHGHPYISTGRHHDKFGIAIERVRQVIPDSSRFKNCKLVGLHAHLGSQVTEITPFAELGKIMKNLAREALSNGHVLRYLDIGGGMRVDYQKAIDVHADSRGKDDFAVDPDLVAEALLDSLGELDLQLVIEPGRSLLANTGVLLTQVLYKKDTAGKNFIIVDAGMSELIRPSLYQAYHAIVPVELKNSQTLRADIVGPICESGDFLARDRELPSVERGDVLAVLTTGAYGFSLSSNYNARLRPAEILISGKDYRAIRERQKIENLWK
jgi:diaminopimelate decarboxylase